MITRNTRNRIQAISIEGSVTERYFEVTSDVPRNTVASRTSAMPRNGLSACAGVDRAAGLFSANGNGARSSLADAADGGDNGRTRCENEIIESAALKNAKRRAPATAENRKPICACVRDGTPHPISFQVKPVSGLIRKNTASRNRTASKQETTARS